MSDRSVPMGTLGELRDSMDRGELSAARLVDDCLDRVAGLGVRCALAAWGYNGEREVEMAHQRGYRICTLKNFEEQLFDS